MFGERKGAKNITQKKTKSIGQELFTFVFLVKNLKLFACSFVKH